MVMFKLLINSIKIKVNLTMWSAKIVKANFSQNPYKPKTREVLHPHILEPEHLKPCPKLTAAKTDPIQKFIPVGYYRNLNIESSRTGEYLGEDYPFNFLPKWKHWRRRKYNVITNTIPWFKSEKKGVLYYDRLNVWACQWMEDGVHRIRRFRSAFGLLKSKEAAEKFRMDLEGAGRIDNRKSQRQLRLKYIQEQSARNLRKKKYAKISSGSF